MLYISLETNPDKLADRLIACDTGVNLSRIKTGEMEDGDWTRIVERSDRVRDLKFDVVQAAGWTVDQIRAKSIQEQAEIIFVDYLGLIASKGKSLYEQTTNASKALHTMAQDTGITVIALSQLNRSANSGEPDMTTLKDSGQVEQDADIILMLANPDDPQDKGRRKLMVRKNKEGRRGLIKLSFDGDKQRFYEIEETLEESE